MLKFIGNGSAFNERLGNNSAFILDETNEELILIDCGSSVFHKLIEAKLLENVDKVSVIITHLHPDHVGSLGDLIFYNYYAKGICTNIYYPENDVVSLLTLMDVDAKFYKHIEDSSFTISDYKVSIIPQSHRGQQKAYGYFIKDNYSTIFFSGDSNTINPEILTMLKNGELDILYQDVSSFDFESNPHLSMIELLELVPADKRDRIICMHLDNEFDEKLAIEKRLNVSKNIFEDRKEI